MPGFLRGRYEPLEVAGRGGQGEVLRALDHQHGRPVALKARVLHDGEDPGEREEVLSEARVLLDLRPHPALPLVREDFFEGGRYYLVMDWIEGEDLQTIVDRRGGLPLEETVGMLREVAGALDHLHAHVPPVVHHDVKPANVRLTPDGRVVLVDFGISRRASDPLVAAHGTPAYRAPEALKGASAAAAGDVFGLAATALALLSGSPPRPGPRPPLPGVANEHLDRVWAGLNAGLAYDPARRPPSARAFVEGLVPPATPNNVPAALTTYIGRLGEKDLLAARLQDSRLVTLTGPGGVGKTRLALEVASNSLLSFRGGVWLVELAPVSAGAVWRSVAGVAGAAEEAGRSLEESLVEACGEARILFVLDNCEHVVGTVAQVAKHLLTRCPGVRILATSREALGVPGEATFQLAPLAVPDEFASAALETIAENDAVRLFCDRASLAVPGFTLEGATARSVAGICAILEGMPLAIELAAARITHMGPAQIAERLHDRFALLTSGARTSDARHQTLRAAVDWSYDLLSSDERGLFAVAGAFAGSFTLEAAETLAPAAGLESSRVLDLLASLVSKSLLVTAIRGEETRYRMLETLRAYAVDRLAAIGLEEPVRDAQLAWARTVAELGASRLGGPEQAASLDRLEAEHDNLRSALEYAAANGRSADLLALAVALAEFWEVHGHWTQGRRCLEDAAALDERATAIRAAALHGAANLALAQGDLPGATSLARASLAVARELDHPEAAAAALRTLGRVAESHADYQQARALVEEALGLLEGSGDARVVGDCLVQLGIIAESKQDWVEARRLLSDALETYRSVGDKRGIAHSLAELGYVTNYTGDAMSRELLEESLSLYRDVGDRKGTARALVLVAIRAFLEGDPVAALALGRESLTIRADLGDRLGMAVAIESLAGLAAFVGQAPRAARLFGGAEALRERIDAPVSQSDRDMMAFAISLARQALGEDEFADLWRSGRDAALQDILGEALSDATS